MKLQFAFLSHLRGVGCAIIVLSAFSSPMHAEEIDSTPALDFAVGLPGKQVELNWPAQPGLRYHVEKSTTLGAGGSAAWVRVATVDATGPTVEWRDPQAIGERCFYRVTKPQPEVFSIEPPVLAISGGSLLIRGQCLPAGTVLDILDESGEVVASFPLVEEIAGRWRADVTGTFPPGSSFRMRVVAPGGATLGGAIPLEVTLSGFASDAPSALPPGAPLPLSASNPVSGSGTMEKKGSSHSKVGPILHVALGASMSSTSPDPEDCDDADDVSGLGILSRAKIFMWVAPSLEEEKKKSSHRVRPPSSGIPGEVAFHFDALSLPCPAGPPLSWVMTYRSGFPVSSGHGPQWDSSYNISIEPQPAGSGSTAPRLIVRDGGGRADVFHRQTDGTYRCEGLYRQGSFSGNTFTLTFADQGKWVFNPLDGSPAAGKIASITDRNNVSLTCAYDAATGLLSSVSDAFSRSLSVNWDSSSSTPRISSVADSFGRIVHFTAFSSGETGGAEGALKSIFCVEMPGAPPEAAPFHFTYTKGQTDPNLDNNLLSITDGAGRLLEAFTYHSTSDRRSVEYDRCATHDRRGGGHVTVLKSAPNSSGGYTIYQVDELGRLTETDCDKLHRAVSIRQFTGVCTPGTPATATTNRPSGKLRADDLDFYETQYSWNADHALVQATDPDGSQLRFVHEREMKPGCPVIERGNVRTVTLRSPMGETRAVSFEYQPGFGTLESAMPGGPIKGISVKCGRNPGGEIVGRIASNKPDDDGDGFAETAMFRKILDRGEAGDNVGLLLRSKGTKNPSSSGYNINIDSLNSLINPIAMDKGLRVFSGKGVPKDIFVLKNDTDEKLNFSSQFSGSEEGGRHTPFQNKYRPQFSSRGITINTSHVEYRIDEDCDDADPAFSVAKQSQGATFGERLNQGLASPGRACGVMELISGSSYKLKAGFLYAAEPTTPRISRVITGHGQEISWTYDARGNPLSYATPIAGSGATFTYDTLGRCSGVSLADGSSSFVTEFEHDAATGMPSRVVQNPGELAITTQFEYDPLGRCIREVDPMGFDTLYEYLPSGRLSRCESPPVGSSRIATTFHYDQACRLVRCDVDNRDSSGALHSSNSSYSAFFVYDNRARLVRIAEEERPVEVTSELTPDSLGIENFAVCDFTINPAGEITRVSTPAACRGSTADLVCDYQFDERGLLYRCIQGGLGSSSSIVDQIDYSSSGLPVRTARLVGGTAVSQLACDYDGFHRLSSVTDPMGNVVQFSYDSRGGVTTEVYGEPTDAPGSDGNVLLSRSTTVSSIRFGNATSGDISIFGAVRGRNPKKWVLEVGEGDVEIHALSLPGLSDANYEIKVPNPPATSARSLFHGWETRDDTITEERFVAGSTAPPVVETTVITRSPAGLVKQVTRNGDVLASLSHDSAGRTITCMDGACTVSVTRDKRGDILMCGTSSHFRVGGLPPKTFTTTHQYDSLGRLVSSTDSSGNTTTQGFDSLGRLHTMVTAMACTVTYDYDGSSSAGAFSRRVTGDLDGDGAPDIVVFSLHRCGEWISSTDAKGYVTSATNDALGRLSRVDYPDGTYETFSYNARGLHHNARLTDGTTRVIDHDLNGRAVAVALSGSPAGVVPVPPTVCAYDGLGRVVSCTQGTSVLSFAWDSLGACVGETQGTVTVSSSFNHRGRTSLMTSVQHPYQLHLTENRDSLGRVLSVSLIDATGTPLPPVASFEHLGHAVSRIISGNGVSSNFTYRGAGDAPVAGDHTFGLRPVRCVVTSSSGAVLSDSNIARAPDQSASFLNTLFGDDPAGASRQLSLARDSLSRVTQWSTSRREGAGLPPIVENDVSYALDARGDRTATTGGPYPGSYTQSTTLPPGDAQRACYTSWPQGALQWDAKRNLTRIPYGDVTHTMQYDALGRLVSVTDEATGSPVAEYSYDALDRLVTLTVHESGVPPHFTRFIYDGSVCVQELGGDGVADLTHVVSGGVRHCISTRNGTIYYPHSSSLSYIGPCDASEVITGSTGAVIEHRACDGDGRPLFLLANGLPSSTGASAMPIRWVAPEILHVPNTRTCTCHGGYYVYSLGTTTGKFRKKEYVGHGTLMK